MEAPERQYFIPQLGKGSTGPSVISDAGKVFQLQRRHFVRAAQPDLVDDPVEMGLEVLETAGWDVSRKIHGSARFPARLFGSFDSRGSIWWCCCSGN